MAPTKSISTCTPCLLDDFIDLAALPQADWEGKHPWKPWNRDTDLDVRAANPKGKESILNNQHMGTLGDRFGTQGRKETTFM